MVNLKNKSAAVLCSGFALGLYVPGLLIDRGLRRAGSSSSVYIFESLILDGKKENITASKNAYHRNFNIAKMSFRMHLDIRKSIDYNRVDELLESWKQAGIVSFIVLSGHWFYVIDEYRKRMAPLKINITILYIDCDLPPSWSSLKHFIPDYNRGCTEIELYDVPKAGINFRISVTNEPPVPYSRRGNRVLIHGGGWGMGTYLSKIPELQSRGISMNIVVNELDEALNKNDKNRYFMIDPSWRAWNKDREGEYGFPLFGEITGSSPPVFGNKKAYHDLFDVTSQSMAIIGKCGAGVLIDSLNSATPVVMLEPVGVHEEKNGALWRTLNFGIDYEEWKKQDFSFDILKQLHENLLTNAGNYPDFAEHYKNRTE